MFSIIRTGFVHTQKIRVARDNSNSDAEARSNIKQLLSIFRPAPRPTPEQDLSPSITTSNDPSFSR